MDSVRTRRPLGRVVLRMLREGAVEAEVSAGTASVRITDIGSILS